MYDFDRAEALLEAPREDLLRYRIDALRNLGDPASRSRLMGDLLTLLEVDQSTATLNLVADYMLRFAEAIPEPEDREPILAQVETMLARIEVPNGPTAIARAQILHLRGSTTEAVDAAHDACSEFAHEPHVHEITARIYRAVGLVERADAEASIAQMMRQEDRVDDPTQTPKPSDAPPLDTGTLLTWVQDLGRLFGEPVEDRGKER